MNDLYRLESNFENEFGENRKIIIYRSVTDLIEKEIKPAMQTSKITKSLAKTGPIHVV